jgi:glutamine amidotransferase
VALAGERVNAPRVVVLDYGSGNLRSAERALARVGADVTVTGDLAAAADADGLVVPGVGAFAACMAGIDAVGARKVIAERVADDRPVLGICVGMQVLFAAGEEHGERTEGIGVLPGEVRRLRAERVPHMGWNTVRPAAGSRLFAGVDPGTRYYFVHSYAAVETEDLVTTALVTTAEHGESFVAAVERGALTATQFHPEKSADAGAALLATWVGGL